MLCRRFKPGNPKLLQARVFDRSGFKRIIAIGPLNLRFRLFLTTGPSHPVKNFVSRAYPYRSKTRPNALAAGGPQRSAVYMLIFSLETHFE